jgi:hypothetical protein
VLLESLTASAEVGSDGWCWVQLWLACATNLCADDAAALEHDTALGDAAADRGPSTVPAHGLADGAIWLTNLGRPGEAAEDARRALAMAREIGYRAAAPENPKAACPTPQTTSLQCDRWIRSAARNRLSCCDGAPAALPPRGSYPTGGMQLIGDGSPWPTPADLRSDRVCRVHW